MFRSHVFAHIQCLAAPGAANSPSSGGLIFGRASIPAPSPTRLITLSFIRLRSSNYNIQEFVHRWSVRGQVSVRDLRLSDPHHRHRDTSPPYFSCHIHSSRLTRDELLRLVIDELVETGRRSAVPFALTRQSFEEPTLSSLWKEQTSFLHLLMVLRGCTCFINGYSYTVVVGGHDFPTHSAQYSILIPPGDRTRSFSGGLCQVPTICFLDAWTRHRSRRSPQH